MLITILFVYFFSPILTQSPNERTFNRVCGQVFTDKQFVIESIGYPSNYPINHQCSYLIKGPSCPLYITLHLLEFNVEESLGCAKDRLEIDDKDAICGNTKGSKTYYAKNGALVLRFISDSSGTGRGYRILVNQSNCSQENQPLSTSTTTPKWYTTSRDVEFTTAGSTVRNYQKCCQNIYKNKQFTLTSPGFPYSMTSVFDCGIEIRKTNPSICRLRLHFNFFFLGRRVTSDCSKDYLEIDNHRVCGCKTNFNLISPFLTEVKVLRFVSTGFERNSYSGFVVEVIQDECPQKLANSTHIYKNDQIYKLKNDESVIEKLSLIRENTEVLPRDEGSIVQHVYYFGEEPEREETNYIYTENWKSIVESSYYGYAWCKEWNQRQFDVIPKINTCRENQNALKSENGKKQCVELGYKRGYFQSPGYPFYYPRNTNVCYRFKAMPGNCAVRVYMQDFNVEPSQSCMKDYFSLTNNKQRYCGNHLNNNIFTINLNGRGYEEMNFVTDDYYCGRGFFGSYEQIDCPTQPAYPFNPVPPTSASCTKSYNEELFTIEIQGMESCIFTIEKFRPEVCKLRLYFEQFDLFCAYESVTIDGMMYCGRLTGKSVTVDLNSNLNIVYKKRYLGQEIRSGGAKIKALQIWNDCSEQEVASERFSDPESLSQNFTTYLLKIDSEIKEICGMINNITEVETPETFCNFLMQNANNITECIPLAENLLIVPFESQKIELKIGETETIEEIEFDEVDCEDIFTTITPTEAQNHKSV